jgi:hypothetical protein
MKKVLNVGLCALMIGSITQYKKIMEKEITLIPMQPQSKSKSIKQKTN